MKIVNMNCPNCGASIQVDADKKNATCNYCGSSLFVDDEVQHVQYDNAEETGYQFERGRQRAKAEVYNQQSREKKRKTWLWVLGWICIFPLPLTLLLLRRKEMKPALKYGLIVIAWLLYVIIAFPFGSSSNKDVSDAENSAIEYDDMDAEDVIGEYIKLINESDTINFEFVEDFVPSDKNGGHYRTEFRLGAYKDTIGKSYKYDDTTVDIIFSANGVFERMYMVGASYEQCENIIRYTSSIFDSTVTETDIQDAIKYVTENRSANGYYYGKLGLLMIGGGDQGYEFMLKRS